MYFNIEEAKETVLDLSLKTVRVLWMCSAIVFYFNAILVYNDSM